MEAELERRVCGFLFQPHQGPPDLQTDGQTGHTRVVSHRVTHRTHGVTHAASHDHRRGGPLRAPGRSRGIAGDRGPPHTGWPRRAGCQTCRRTRNTAIPSRPRTPGQARPGMCLGDRFVPPSTRGGIGMGRALEGVRRARRRSRIRLGWVKRRRRRLQSRRQLGRRTPSGRRARRGCAPRSSR